MYDRQLEALFDQACDLYDQNAYRPAVTKLETLLALDPECAPAHGLLALCRVYLGDDRGARSAAGAALALDADQRNGHMALVLVIGKRHPNSAWGHAALIMELTPEEPGSYTLAAWLRRQQHDNDAARELLDQALALAPDDPGVLTDLANLCFDIGELGDAIGWAERALRADPTHAPARIVLGQVALEKRQLAEAHEHARAALSEHPEVSGGVALLIEIRIARNKLTWPFWRFASFAERSAHRKISALMYVVAAGITAVIALSYALGYSWLGGYIAISLLALSAYTQLSVYLVERMVEKELKSLELNDEF